MDFPDKKLYLPPPKTHLTVMYIEPKSKNKHCSDSYIGFDANIVSETINGEKISEIGSCL